MYETLEQKDYYVNIREFNNGEFEAILKVVKPMKSDLIENSINGTTYGAACAAIGESSYQRRATLNDDSEESETKRETNRERACRRSAQSVRFLAKQMGADRLFTLTYRANEGDREAVKATFKKFVRIVKAGFKPHKERELPGVKGEKNWQYIAVLEKQDRGAYHIHCAVKGWQRIDFLRRAWYVACGGTGFETGKDTPGQVDVTNPKTDNNKKLRQWRVNKLVGYLTKYMQKTFAESDLTEKRRYWQSRQLEKPAVQRHFVSGSEIIGAIKSLHELLGFHVDIQPGFTQWLSRSCDSYWVSGKRGLTQ